MILAHLGKFLCSALLSLAASGCMAQERVVPTDWKPECVGRMQLSLPSEAEVAANTFEMLRKEFVIGSQQPRFDFPDGRLAGYSSLRYEGRLLISHPIKDTEYAALHTLIQENEKTAQAFAKTRNYEYEKFSIGTLEGVASRVDESYSAFLKLDDSILYWEVSGEPGDRPLIDKSLKTILNGVSRRDIHSVPTSPGVCIPYAFIADGGSGVREIAVTYRLKAHPDVTIWLEDNTAARVGPGQNPNKFTDIAKTKFFWEQDYQYRKRLESIWPDGSRETRLAGYEGVATLLELTRPDDTIDYGYLAVVRGDPDAKEDTPDLMLYVIRDAKNAKAKGIEPIGKEAFIEMAQTIAASVKRRPANVPQAASGE